MNKMIDWTKHAHDHPFDLEAHHGRLLELAALLTAIGEGELLSDLPADSTASARHAAGSSLLAILERELAELVCDLEFAVAQAEVAAGLASDV